MSTKFQTYQYQFGNRFLDNIIDWIKNNLMPEDVFSKNALADWARENGYVHESTLEESEQ